VMKHKTERLARKHCNSRQNHEQIRDLTGRNRRQLGQQETKSA
jgi:hypothetical protein